MKKLVKVIAIVILVLFIALIVLPLAFKGKIKEMVIREANKNLSATLEVGGVQLSLIRNFPLVYIGLKDVRITGLGSFESDTLLNVKTLAISARIMDLINGSPYEIRKILIDQADVRLKILADGQENWDIIKASDRMEEAPEPEGGSDFNLSLKSLVIKDSRLIYDDIPYETYVILDGLDHQLSGDLSADFTTLKTQTRVSKALVSYEGVTYLFDAILDWQADIDADLHQNVYTFKENKLRINDFAIVFNGSAGLPDKGYELDLTFETPDQSFKQFLSLIPAIYSQDFASISTEGTFGFNGFVKGRYIEEQLPAFQVDLIVKDAWFRYPDLPSAVEDISILARIENPGGDADNTVIDVSKVAANLAGNPVNARLLLKNPISDPYVDTRVDIRLNLADVEKFYPLEEGETLAGNIIADFSLKGRLSDVENGRYQAFEAAGIIQSSGIRYATAYISPEIQIESLNLAITPAYLDLTELSLVAGKSDFNLNGKLENYLAYYLKNETLRGYFSLNAVLIDVNELLTHPDTEEPAAEEPADLSAFIVPSNIDFTLNTSAAAIDYKNFNIRDFKGKILVKDQRLTLENSAMDLLGGQVQLSGFYETSDPENPLVDISLGMKSISIPETFRSFVMVEKFAPIVEKIVGELSGNIDLAGLLDNKMRPRLEMLNGGGKLVTSALEIRNVNTLNQLSGLLKMDQLKDLKVAGTSVVVQFIDGVMDVKPFDFKAMGIDMTLGGQTSLDQRIGYLLKMKIPRSMMGGAANNVLNDLVGKASQSGFNIQPGDYINLNALIEGTISDPKVSLDLAGTGNDILQTVKDQVKEQVDQIKEQAREEVEKYIQEAERRAQDILDGAQRQSDELMNKARQLADETKKQMYAQADNIIKEAKGSGTFTELAAQKSADEVRKQGDKQAQNILDEAQNQSNAIMDKARLESEKIMEEARGKVN